MKTFVTKKFEVPKLRTLISRLRSETASGPDTLGAAMRSTFGHGMESAELTQPNVKTYILNETLV